jgi:hypothetical protein
MRTLAGAVVAALVAGCGAEPERLVAVGIAGGEYGFAWSTQVQLHATAIYSDGTVEFDVDADWVSSAPSIAKVTKNPSYGATVTAMAPGAAVITATYAGVTGSVELTVPPP